MDILLFVMVLTLSVQTHGDSVSKLKDIPPFVTELMIPPFETTLHFCMIN